MAPPIKPLMERLLERKVENGECWEWRGSYGKDGYGVMTIQKAQKRVHRVAYELFTGNSAEGLFVCHRCDNPKCFNPAHLFAGTAKQNTQDMLSKGRKARIIGTSHPNSILKPDDVSEIRRKRNVLGLSLKQVAKEHGISFQHVSDLARGKAWTHM